jgi:hypothetical protein
MNKFLIFTDARTGSISLSKILSSLYNNKLPYDVITEPFCKDSLKDYYPDLHSQLKENLKHINKGGTAWKTSLKDIERILDKCFERSSGIKHIWSHLDLEGKLQNEFILNYAIRKKIKIILLSRESFVLRLISLDLASQSSIWSVDNQESKDEVKKATYEAIKIDELDKGIKEYNDYLFRYKTILEPFSYYDITYEDLFKVAYEKEDKFEQQIKEVKKICKFLGLNTKNLRKDVLEFNLGKDRKQNTREIYKKIPNIKEIVEYSKKWNKDLSWILE